MNFFARNQIRNSVSQETKHKTTKHQKNNRLFIPANQQQLNLNEFKGRKKYTNSLYWFTLKPRATSSPQNPLGNPIRNQNTDYTQNHQRSDLEPLKKHTSFGSTHTKNVDLDNLKSTQHSLVYNTRIYKVFRTNYTCYRMN